MHQKPVWRARVTMTSDAAVRGRNEDRAGHVADGRRLAAWIIDGASPLVQTGRIHASSSMDVRWFVRSTDRYLSENSLKGADPRTLFRQAISAVYGAYFSLARAGRGIPLFERPLAAVSWVRVDLEGRHARLEYLRMGDCPFFVRTPEGDMLLEAVGDAGAENAVRRKVEKSLRRGGVPEGPALTQHLRSRRARQHEDASIGVFAMNPDAVEHGTRGSLRVERPFDIVMATDGLFRLVDLFGRYSAAEFCARCNAGGFDALTSELRKLENSNGSQRRHPRLKRNDDASGLLVQCRSSIPCLRGER